MIKIIKEFFSNAWNYIWSKTTVDEKAVATVKEIKKRYKLTTQELADLAKAIKEVGNQIGDIDDAIAGKERKGRKKKNKTASYLSGMMEEPSVATYLRGDTKPQPEIENQRIGMTDEEKAKITERKAVAMSDDEVKALPSKLDFLKKAKKGGE